MIDYNNIWFSINNESESTTIKTQIARKIPSEGVISVFLASDFKKHIRLLYIKLEGCQDISVENLPKFKGLEITHSITSIGSFVNEKFLKFAQTIPNTENIFELMISDICENVIHLQNNKNLQETLTKVLAEWKLFFEKQENEILSIENQKGLVGELFFLKDFLFKKYPYAEALLCWTGSDRTNHDFQLENKAVEVKTTSSKQHKKFYISSERQLDSIGLEHLYISLFSLNLHINIPEKTLPAIITEIESTLQGDNYAKFIFQLKLVKYGYDEILKNKYTTGFSLLDMKFFEVIDGFPRLLQMNIPYGIGDLKYSVMVSSCIPFEIKTNILNKI